MAINTANEKPFKTIRQAAATGLVSEHHLRLRLKQGKLPGFYSGRWFWVDYPALVDLLHEESRSRVQNALDGSCEEDRL